MNRTFLNLITLSVAAILAGIAFGQNVSQDEAEIRSVEKPQQDAWNRSLDFPLS